MFPWLLGRPSSQWRTTTCCYIVFLCLLCFLLIPPAEPDSSLSESKDYQQLSFPSPWPEKWSYHIPRPANGRLLEDTLSSSSQFCRSHKKKSVKCPLVLTDEGLVEGVGDMLKSGKEVFFDSFLFALNSGCRKQDNSVECELYQAF